MKYFFYSTCVSWPPSDVFAEGGLSEMINDAIEITRRTFLEHIELSELLEISLELGYSKHPSQGLTMAGDWAISYHRSTLHKKRVYYFRWSGIEYVFTTP